MESFLGIDLGGTKLLIGEVDREGNILNFKNTTTASSTNATP